MGDRVRPATGSFQTGGVYSTGVEFSYAGGVFEVLGPAYYANSDSMERRNAGLSMNLARVVPVGATNIPRSWGSLACAYFGQVATG